MARFKTLRRRFALITPPFTRDINDYLNGLHARKEVALLTSRHWHLLGTLLVSLGAATLLCIEMILARLAYDKFALTGYADPLAE